MISFEYHLSGTVSAITIDIFLTKDWNKNIICTSIAAKKYEVISKNIW